MAIVYRHIRLDKNEPFYIGIGNNIKRAYNFSLRTKWWKNIVKITDLRVDILFDDLTWDEACEKEKELIKLYGRKDLGTGTLVNMTDGGEGLLGYIPNKETRQKLSQSQLGEKNNMKSLSARQKSSKSHLGYKIKDETKKKLSEMFSGEKNPFYGKKHSPETIDLLKEKGKKLIGEKNPFYGKNHTEEYKKKSSEIKQKKPKPRFFNKWKKPWHVSFIRYGETIRLGRFSTEQEAQEAINLWIKNNTE